jgi:hypothetical protein
VEGDQVDRLMHQAITYLKQTYPRYVAGSPVHLVTSARYATSGMRLLLREPGVFAYTYLEGLDPDELTSTVLAALEGKGARALVVSSEFSPRLKLLARAAGRGGMKLLSVSPQGGIQEALSLFAKLDERLASLQAADHGKGAEH